MIADAFPLTSLLKSLSKLENQKHDKKVLASRVSSERDVSSDRRGRATSHLTFTPYMS